MFSLAFGKQANWQLVKKVAAQNNGLAKKIYEDSDADLQVDTYILVLWNAMTRLPSSGVLYQFTTYFFM